jgi:hypothetical protein
MQRRSYRIKNGIDTRVPLDYDDCSTISYLSVIETINRFNLRQFNYSFMQAMCTVNHSNIWHEVNHNLTIKNTVLNRAIDSTCLDINNTLHYAEDVEQNYIEKLTFDEMRERVLDFALDFKNHTKQIIEFKMKGYTDFQISQQLKMGVKKVSNAYAHFVRRFRQQHRSKTE